MTIETSRRLSFWSARGLLCLLTVVGFQTLVTPVRAQDDSDTATKPAARKNSTKATDNTNSRNGKTADVNDASRDDQSGNQRNARRAWIGVRLHEPDTAPTPGHEAKESKDNEKGVEVLAVYPSGPAARGGIQAGDRIESVDGKSVSSPREVSDTVGSLTPGKKVAIVVMRSDKEQTLNVTLGDAAQFHPHGQQAFAQQGNGQQQGYQAYSQGGNGQNGQPGAFNQADHYQDVPEHAMMLEYNRRNSEQHQRMESQIEELLQEVKALRKEVQQLKAK